MKREPSRLFSKKKARPPLCAWLAYLLVCSLLLAGASLARYVATGSAGDTARVAAWNVDVIYDKNQTNIELIRPSDDGIETKDFNFTVSSTGSEVACQYDIIVTLKKVWPLSGDSKLPNGAAIALDERILKTEDGTAGTNGEITYTFPDAGTLTAGTSRQHTLSFSGNFDSISSGTDDKYSITISVRAKQID